MPLVIYGQDNTDTVTITNRRSRRRRPFSTDRPAPYFVGPVTASITHLSATTDTANTTSYPSGAFTPIPGELLIAFVSASATTATGTTLTASANGITFTRVATAVRGGSLDTLYVFVANQLVPASPVSMTVTFDCAADPATGVVTFVASASYMTKVGSAAVRQVTNHDNYASNNPTVRFPKAPLTTNPQLVFMGNATVGGAAVNPPTNFIEGADANYITPDRGAEYAWRNAGGASQSIQWASSSSTASGSIGIELDSSVTAPPAPTTPYVVDVTMSHSDDTGGVGSVAPAMPTGWLPGDVLLLVAAINGPTRTFTGKPAGYTQIRDTSGTINVQTYLAYRVAQAGDAAPTVTFSTSDTSMSFLMAIRNLDIADLFGSADAHTDTAAASTVTFPDVTPRAPDDFLVRIVTTRAITAGILREFQTNPDMGVGSTPIREFDAASDSVAGQSIGLAVWTQQLIASTPPGADSIIASATTVDYSAESICFRQRSLDGFWGTPM